MSIERAEEEVQEEEVEDEKQDLPEPVTKESVCEHL